MGVDDGLLPNDESGVVPNHNPVRPPSRRPSYQFPGYNGPGFVNINGVDTPIPDINAYQQKKTLAQGMMDLALLSANANQLRYVLESYKRHPYYYPSLIFISLSIIFQVSYPSYLMEFLLILSVLNVFNLFLAGCCWSWFNFEWQI